MAGRSPKKIKRLTPKQHKFVKEVISHPEKTVTQCARDAGYMQPQNEQSRLLSNPQIQEEFRRLMELNPNLRREGLLNTLAEGLKATRPDPCGPGEIVDYSVRHKYLDTALKVSGVLNPASSEPTNALQLNITADTIRAGVILPDGSGADISRFLGPKTQTGPIDSEKDSPS